MTRAGSRRAASYGFPSPRRPGLVPGPVRLAGSLYNGCSASEARLHLLAPLTGPGTSLKSGAGTARWVGQERCGTDCDRWRQRLPAHVRGAPSVSPLRAAPALAGACEAGRAFQQLHSRQLTQYQPHCTPDRSRHGGRDSAVDGLARAIAGGRPWGCGQRGAQSHSPFTALSPQQKQRAERLPAPPWVSG